MEKKKEAEDTEINIELGMIDLLLKPKHLHQIDNFRKDSSCFLICLEFCSSLPMPRCFQLQSPECGTGTGICDAYQGRARLCALGEVFVCA